MGGCKVNITHQCQHASSEMVLSPRARGGHTQHSPRQAQTALHTFGLMSKLPTPQNPFATSAGLWHSSRWAEQLPGQRSARDVHHARLAQTMRPPWLSSPPNPRHKPDDLDPKDFASTSKDGDGVVWVDTASFCWPHNG